MESTCMELATTMSMLFAAAGPQGWADLPIELLQSIIMLLSCTRDLLAFVATCSNWRASFMLAKPTLSKLFLPLIVQSCAHLSSNGQVHHTWQLMDPANPTIRFHRQIPPTIMNMEFLGCSYGHAIFASIDTSRIAIVDVFTGTSISPPLFPAPFAKVGHYGYYYNQTYFSLTAAMSSAKACLFVSTSQGLFVWRIGSDAWQKCFYRSCRQPLPIKQIVTFKGQIIALSDPNNLYVVHMDAPHHDIILEKIPIVWENVWLGIYEPIKTWLVVCKEMLVLVARIFPFGDDDFSFFYLDSSTDPARWLPATNLDHVVFISSEYQLAVIESACPSRMRHGRGHVYSICPNRWGGIRGHLHLPPGRDVVVFPFTSGRLLPSWVLPTVLMSDGTGSTPQQCNGNKEAARKEEKPRSAVRRSNRVRKPVIRLNL